MGCVCIKDETLSRMQREMFAMPSWCTIEQIKFDQKRSELVAASWREVMSGQTVPFLEAQKSNPTLTPLVYFYNSFYWMLFEMVPEVKPLFKRKLSSQGRMLANVVKFIVTNVREESDDVFTTSLQTLAAVHNARGIHAKHYSVMGECLLHAIRVCTGPESYTTAVHTAWVQVYTRMMQAMIPVVVADLRPGDKRLKSDKHQLNYHGADFKVETKKQDEKQESKAETKNEETPTKEEKSDSSEHRFEPVNFARTDVFKLDEKVAAKVKADVELHLTKNVTFKMETYRAVIVGCELVDFLLEQKIATTRQQCVDIGSQLLSLGLRPLEDETMPFLDNYTFYTFVAASQQNSKESSAVSQSARLELTPDRLLMLKTAILQSDLLADRSYKLVQYKRSLIGASLVDWMLANKHADSREEAATYGKQLFQAGLRHVQERHGFKDQYLLYTFEQRGGDQAGMQRAGTPQQQRSGTPQTGSVSAGAAAAGGAGAAGSSLVLPGAVAASS